jgi:hypothetical protein
MIVWNAGGYKEHDGKPGSHEHNEQNRPPSVVHLATHDLPAMEATQVSATGSIPPVCGTVTVFLTCRSKILF